MRGRWQRVVSVTARRQRGQGHDRLRRLDPGGPQPEPAARARAFPSRGCRRTSSASTRCRRGFQVELLGSTSQLGSDTNFTRIVVRDERRFRLTDRWHVHVRGEIGASAVGDFEELPAKYRFFAGGDQSVRGYGYEELSPVDEDGNKIGGRHLLTGSVELQRDLPKNLVAAVFVDAGNAFDNFGDPLEYSVGVGLRYRLPFLSIGLDVAQSISESGRSPRVHINFTPEF